MIQSIIGVVDHHHLICIMSSVDREGGQCHLSDSYISNKRPASADQYISLIVATCRSTLQPQSLEVRGQVHRSSIRPELWIVFTYAPRSHCKVLENSILQNAVLEFVHSSSVTLGQASRQAHSAIPLWSSPRVTSGLRLRWTFGTPWYLEGNTVGRVPQKTCWAHL